MVRLFPLLCRSMNRFCKRLKCFPHDMRTYEKSRFRGGASKSSQSIREWGNPRRTSESLVLTHYTIPDGSFSLYSTLCILSSGFVSFLLLFILNARGAFVPHLFVTKLCNTLHTEIATLSVSAMLLMRKNGHTHHSSIEKTDSWRRNNIEKPDRLLYNHHGK